MTAGRIEGSAKLHSPESLCHPSRALATYELISRSERPMSDAASLEMVWYVIRCGWYQLVWVEGCTVF